MAKVLSNITVVEFFVVDKSHTTNLIKKWGTGKEEFELFIVACAIKEEQQQKALLLHLAGKEVGEIYKTLSNSGDNFQNVITKLNGYFQPKKNLSYERYGFNQTKQEIHEDNITYITRLRTLAEYCEFHSIEDEFDQLIRTCRSDKIRKRLLQEQNLTLDKPKSIAISEETARNQAANMIQKKRSQVIMLKINSQNKVCALDVDILRKSIQKFKALGRICYTC